MTTALAKGTFPADLLFFNIKKGVNEDGNKSKNKWVWSNWKNGFRAAFQRDDIEIVGINDLLDVDYLAYMLKYDSVHGRFQGDVSVDNGSLVVNGSKIRITAERDPSDLAWGDVEAEVVVESTGFFLTDETARKHIDAGAKKVILSAPSKDSTPMFVCGVNTDAYAGQDIVSNASCTTNCLAPIAKVLNDKFGIEKGLMTTVHTATATQKTVDESLKDWGEVDVVF